MRNIRLLLLITFCVSCYPAHSAAADVFLQSIGVRGGLSATATASDYHQYEAYGVFRLPWELRARSGWGVWTQLDVAAGLLEGEGDSAFIASAGPGFVFGKTGFPLALDLGVNVAVMSRERFGARNLNGNLQFISHVGLDYRFSKKFGIGYRFQHLSHAGLNGGSNPGLNMQLIGLNWYLAD